MTTCPKCHVAVHSQHTHCPLCQTPLSLCADSITAYPTYRYTAGEVLGMTWVRLFLCLTLAIAIIAGTTNALTYQMSPVLWSPILVVGLLYLWIFIRDTVLSINQVGRKILLNYVVLSIFMLTVDLCIGFTAWSVGYVIPLFGIVATQLMVAFAIRTRSFWQHDIGYLLIMFLISLIPTLLFVFRVSSVLWPCISAMVYSVVVILSFAVFSRKKFKGEMQKRFHL
ncbi:MAG: DUF6320 domain-containing protein [Evtepia sp.]